MDPLPPAIQRLTDIAQLADLAADAQADGRGMVLRLVREWEAGVNRFEKPGEVLCVAACGRSGRVVGVCGLNRDPYAGDPAVGRVRRLYVARSHRRQGIASALLRRLIADAACGFRVLHLRTHDPVADAFYRQMGFSAVSGDPYCTHRRAVP
jgi:GNAT superfamily N-acetyltransferase